MSAPGVGMIGQFLQGLRNIFRLGRRAGGKAARTAGKTGAGEAARKASKNKSASELLSAELSENEPNGFETLLFRQLPRPRLTERSASDLTVEDAKAYAEQSALFYEFGFPLFANSDFFYEEVEEAFLADALGCNKHSIDQRFFDVMILFRQTLNDNTRSMLVWWAPLITALGFGLGLFAALEIEGPLVAVGGAYEGLINDGLIFAAAGLLVLFLVMLIFSWPFKVVQQRNLLNLDNYITSKFGRINHNFQVAKRQALNVERDKRMAQREELKDEAGAWTVAYHWFAMRLFLCELTIRNKFYQIRRNTVLYLIVSTIGAVAAVAGVGVAAWLLGAPLLTLGALGGAGVVTVFLTGLLLQRVTPMMFSMVEANEWSRFHLVDLRSTISDHVGEDKVQIVTFRDRNRFE